MSPSSGLEYKNVPAGRLLGFFYRTVVILAECVVFQAIVCGPGGLSSGSRVLTIEMLRVRVKWTWIGQSADYLVD